MEDDKKQGSCEAQAPNWDFRALAEDILPRRVHYSRMEDEQLLALREGHPRKVVHVMDEIIKKLARSAQLDLGGDGDAADRVRLEVQRDLKVAFWHLLLARLAIQELDMRKAAA